MAVSKKTPRSSKPSPSAGPAPVPAFRRIESGVLDLSAQPKAGVVMPDGAEYPLRLVREFEAGADLEERLARLRDLSLKISDDAELTRDERIEMLRLAAECAAEVVDAPPEVVSTLSSTQQIAVCLHYSQVAQSAMDPFRPAAPEDAEDGVSGS